MIYKLGKDGIMDETFDDYDIQQIIEDHENYVRAE
jgi:hypothetical protein